MGKHYVNTIKSYNMLTCYSRFLLLPWCLSLHNPICERASCAMVICAYPQVSRLRVNASGSLNNPMCLLCGFRMKLPFNCNCFHEMCFPNNRDVMTMYLLYCHQINTEMYIKITHQIRIDNMYAYIYLPVGHI